MLEFFFKFIESNQNNYFIVRCFVITYSYELQFKLENYYLA